MQKPEDQEFKAACFIRLLHEICTVLYLKDKTKQNKNPTTTTKQNRAQRGGKKVDRDKT